jgi:DNA segregation ATPase FtsK/SpoIIIE-like protein
MMHNNGIVGPADGSRPREVLAGLDFLERLDE